MVQMLLQRGADINLLHGGIQNALQEAKSRCREEIVQLLLSKGETRSRPKLYASRHCKFDINDYKYYE